MTSNINGDQLVSALYKNKARLDEKAVDAAFVGGFHLGPIGIPHKALFGVFQSDESKKAEQEPGAYLSAMTSFLKALDECMDKAIEPIRP